MGLSTPRGDAGPTPQPSRVRVATVAPGVEPWRSETLRLFRSLRALGGTLADAPGICYFDRTVDRRIAHQLLDLGVTVRLIAPVDPRCAMGNNLVMLEADEEADWIVACDCDVVVTGDFSDELRGDAVAAVPVDNGLAPIADWPRLYEAFGVPVPTERYRANADGAPIPPYFNAGVLVVPAPLVAPLRASWERWLHAVSDAFDAQQVPAPFATRRAFTDQLALALALAEGTVAHRVLPPGMNAPSHMVMHRGLQPDAIDPRIVHYHHNVGPDGRILPSVHAGVNRAIDRVNTALSAAASDAA